MKMSRKRKHACRPPAGVLHGEELVPKLRNCRTRTRSLHCERQISVEAEQVRHASANSQFAAASGMAPGSLGGCQPPAIVSEKETHDRAKLARTVSFLERDPKSS
jgi:hypothetical protein